MNIQERQTLINQLTHQLEQMDQATLLQLNDLLSTSQSSGPTAGAPVQALGKGQHSHPYTANHAYTLHEVTESVEPKNPSRRRFLTGMIFGGGVGMVTAATGGAAFWGLAQKDLLEAKAENIRLRGLLMLYESLGLIDLDAIAQTGVQSVATLLQGVEGGTLLLKSGIEQVEEALTVFSTTFPTIRRGIATAEEVVTQISEQLQQLEEDAEFLTQWIRPVTGSLEEFTDQGLGLLPEFVASPIRASLTRIKETATTLPELVMGINVQLLTPIRENWLGDEQAQQLEKSLIEPITQSLLEPLQAHLAEFAGLMEQWEANLVQPIEEAVTQRQSILDEIAQYKVDHDIA